MAARLGISVDAFYAQHARRTRTRGLLGVWRAWALREVKSASGMDCILLNGARKCSVYTDRPKQCATYPIWREHVGSKADWQVLADGECPGVARADAELITREDVDHTLHEMDEYLQQLEDEARLPGK